MGEYILVSVILILTGSIYMGLGVCAWRMKKPMWFWTGSIVLEDEIKDVPAYNRANAVMWLVFGSLFWLDAGLGLFDPKLGMKGLIILFVVGFPLLIVCYKTIYRRYKRTS